MTGVQTCALPISNPYLRILFFQLVKHYNEVPLLASFSLFWPFLAYCLRISTLTSYIIFHLMPTSSSSSTTLGRLTALGIYAPIYHKRRTRLFLFVVLRQVYDDKGTRIHKYITWYTLHSYCILRFLCGR